MSIHDTKAQDIKSPEHNQPVNGKKATAMQDNRPGFAFQGKFAPSAHSQNYLADNRPIQKKANNTGLPNQLKANIENLSGHSLDDVNVHYNSNKPAQLQAVAYAQGTDIHIASGQEKHLPHEAWHVVQQKQGRVKPTTQLKGKINVNDDAGLEKEADVMGQKGHSMGLNISSKLITGNSNSLGLVHNAPVQRVGITVDGWDDEDTEDLEAIKSLLESVRDGDATLSEKNKADILDEYEKGTYKEDPELGDLAEKYCQPGASEDAVNLEPEIQEEDKNAWRPGIGASEEDQLHFLRSVVAQTRQIIPIAINRQEEEPRDLLTHSVFLCQQLLVKTFTGMMKSQGLSVDSNYIHPAILERIMLIVSNKAREITREFGEEQVIHMAGVCKDYASIAYGLIRQNDPANVLKASLGFIKDHVFVKVDVHGVAYVVDAWRAPNESVLGVIREAAHIAHLNSLPKVGAFRELNQGILSEKDTHQGNPKKGESLDGQYDDYKAVYRIFKANKDELIGDADEFLRNNEEKYVGAGKF